MGQSCVHGAGRGGGGGKTPRDPGSREWGEAGPGRRSGSRWAARVREARDPPPAPSPGHGYSETARTLTWLRWASRTSGCRCSRRCLACSRRSCRCRRRRRLPLPPPRRPAPPGPTSCVPPGSRTPKGRPQLAPPSRVARQSGLPTVSTSSWEGRPLGTRRRLRERKAPGNRKQTFKLG